MSCHPTPPHHPQVYENNDLGLLNFQLHPDWPTVPYGYMVYTHDPGYVNTHSYV